MKKEKKKEEKRKPKYGMFSCVGYSLRFTWRGSKSTAISAIAIIPIALILRAIGLYMPTFILQELETADVFLRVVYVIVGILVAQTFFQIIKGYIDAKRGNAEHYTFAEMVYSRVCRQRDMDAYLQLDPETKKMFERAGKATENNHAAGVNFVEYFANMIINILCFFLFGSVISLLNPLILLLLIAGCLVNYFMAKWQQKQNYKTRDRRNLISKKLQYLWYYLSGDLSYGKDIRLYGFSDFLDALIHKHEKDWYHEQEGVQKNAFITALVSFLVTLVRDGFAYVFLIYQAVEGNITAAEFVLFFSAITQMSGFISGILNTWSRLHDGALSVSDFREFFDIKDKLNRGPGIPLPQGRPLSIEFRNVSFRYPTGEKKVLDNVSFTIKAGERIALVGVNGAGKTTLTKLMCGLLIPDEGEVLIDGHSVYEYNRDELYTLFSLVPQDYSLMPVSIAENIAVADASSGDDFDREKVLRCAAIAGLDEKLESLPQGIDTPLDRQVHKDAIDLSGGEKQKLLLARAIYREAPILILDEPTAALDPIAEDKMYRRYDEIAQDTTSVFISHRLASTHFCDRIFFLDGAVIAEVGSHEELMAKGGKYRELFEVQAKYYKEGKADEI